MHSVKKILALMHKLALRLQDPMSLTHIPVQDRSPLSPWQPVKKSPASQQKRQVGWAHSPTPVKGTAGKEDVWSAWNQDKAQKLKQKLQVRAYSCATSVSGMQAKSVKACTK